MSKNLLNEAQFRHFARLAQIEPILSEKRFSQFYDETELSDEAPLSEEIPVEDEEEVLDEPLPEEEPAVDLPAPEDMDDVGAVEDNEALLARVVQAVADEGAVAIPVPPRKLNESRPPESTVAPNPPPSDVNAISSATSFLVIFPSESTTKALVPVDVDTSSKYTSLRNLDIKLHICCPIHFII